MEIAELTFRCLVVFQDGADDSGGGTHGGIQHVHVFGLLVHLLRQSKPDLQSPCLVVQTVRTGHQLPVRFGTSKPCFQVKLLGGRVVQFARHNVNNPVQQTGSEILYTLYSNNFALYYTVCTNAM